MVSDMIVLSHSVHSYCFPSQLYYVILLHSVQCFRYIQSCFLYNVGQSGHLYCQPFRSAISA